MILLAGIATLGVGILPMQGAIASPGELPVQSNSRLSLMPTAKVPPTLVNTLRQDLSRRTGIPAKKFRLAEAEPKEWANGCLGLAKPDEMCTQMVVSGWRVVLTNGSRRWIYRTNGNGTVYRLETAALQSTQSPKPVSYDDTAPLQASRIPMHELPPLLGNDVVFRAIASGGFTGRTFQTTLLRDGRMIRAQVRPDGSLAQPETIQIGMEKVEAFQRILKQQSWQKFHRFNYSAAPGSADFVTMTLSSRTATVRYADTVRDRLPSSLQSIITTWNGLNPS